MSADVLQTMSRPPNGMVTISIKSNGFADAAATLVLWQKTGSQFSKYTPAILADGTVQLLPGVDETILGGYSLGQPFDFALVDEATNKRSHAKIVPFPIAAQSAGRCRASAEVQTQSGLIWLILLAGYAAGEQVEIASTVKRKTLKTDAAASTTGEITFPILYPPRSRGNARVRAVGARGCKVSLDFAIGSSALKAK